MVAVTMLLFVACRNNDKQQPVEDSAPAEMPPVTIVDTEPTEPTVTTSRNSSDEELMMELMTVNLKLNFNC